MYIGPSGRLERSIHSLTDQPSQTIRLRLKDQLPESNIRGDDDDDADDDGDNDGDGDDNDDDDDDDECYDDDDECYDDDDDDDDDYDDDDCGGGDGNDMKTMMIMT